MVSVVLALLGRGIWEDGPFDVVLIVDEDIRCR